MKIDEENGRVSVFLKPDQVSLAIGKGGQNIKLASRLVGYEIDVFRESESYEEDISLEEFSDEIEDWVIAELRRIGLDTAKSVLAVTKEDLLRRTELEEETIEDVLSILREELEEEDNQ
jgi:N utilization substance protein A